MSVAGGVPFTEVSVSNDCSWWSLGSEELLKWKPKSTEIAEETLPLHLKLDLVHISMGSMFFPPQRRLCYML